MFKFGWLVIKFPTAKSIREFLKTLTKCACCLIVCLGLLIWWYQLEFTVTKKAEGLLAVSGRFLDSINKGVDLIIKR